MKFNIAFKEVWKIPNTLDMANCKVKRSEIKVILSPLVDLSQGGL